MARGRVSGSEMLLILGAALLSIGLYLPWAAMLAGTAVIHTSLQSAGIYLDRVILLAPILLAAILPVIRRIGWSEVILLAVGSVACAIVPPLRWMIAINNEAMMFGPGFGLIVTVVSSLAFASAATARYFETIEHS